MDFNYASFAGDRRSMIGPATVATRRYRVANRKGEKMPKIEIGQDQFVLDGKEYRRLLANVFRMDEIDEVIGKLGAAALQLSPNDDKIIGDHIRDSVALLLQYRYKIRNHVSNQNIREAV